jgi:hypothetical protein
VVGASTCGSQHGRLLAKPAIWIPRMRMVESCWHSTSARQIPQLHAWGAPLPRMGSTATRSRS